jgi:hypothetical protein
VVGTKAKLGAKATGCRELEKNEGYELKNLPACWVLAGSKAQSHYKCVFDPKMDPDLYSANGRLPSGRIAFLPVSDTENHRFPGLPDSGSGRRTRGVYWPGLAIHLSITGADAGVGPRDPAAGSRAHEGDGIGVQRVIEQGLGRGCFHNSSYVEYRNTIAYMANDR